ncbi:MAG: hypothetical protein GF311_00660 [Candidatus Lokiarchaeota archaeon]|nr:hypothetical protein [Candidatus Lokiarchaeota archaeon]
MKKRGLKGTSIVLLVSVLIFSNLIEVSNASSLVIDPVFGDAPTIDGTIDLSKDEWEQAPFERIYLKKDVNESVGLPTDLKCIQDEENLYLLIQFELEPGSVGNQEFLAILISNSTGEDFNNFKDAKIVNLSNSQYSYNDLYLNDTIYIYDDVYQGKGAATIIEQEAKAIFTFEFLFPLYSEDSSENNEDVTLTYNSEHIFNITHGNNPVLPDGIIRSATIQINILEKQQKPEGLNLNIVALTLTIIVFTFIGLFYTYYIYQIILLRKKMERIGY